MPDGNEGRKDTEATKVPAILTPFSTGFQIIYTKGAAIAVFCLSNIKPDQVNALVAKFRVGFNDATGFFYIAFQSSDRPSVEDPQGSILIDSERPLNVLANWADTVLKQKEIVFIVITDVDEANKDIRTIIVPAEAIPVKWIMETLQPRLAELRKKLPKGVARPPTR
jgi:hypothetical protein